MQLKMKKNNLREGFLRNDNFFLKNERENFDNSFRSNLEHQNNKYMNKSNYGNNLADRSVLSHMPSGTTHNTRKMMKQRDIINTTLPVNIKSKERETHTKVLNLNVKLEEKPSGLFSLNFQLTDLEDLQFLQILDLSEKDYLQLKSSQHLTGDFQDFPTYVSQLIEECLQSNTNQKFPHYCTLDLTKINETLFSVQEDNNFKVLTHISLKFRAASDGQIKSHLASCLARARGENEVLTETKTNLFEELQLAKSNLERLGNQVKNIHVDRDNCETEQRNKHVEEINTLKEKFNREMEELLQKNQKEKNEIENYYGAKAKELNMKVTNLTKENDELKETKMTLMGKNNSLGRELSILNSEFLSVKSRNEKLQNIKDELLNERQESSLKIVKLQTEIEGNLKELESKNMIVKQYEEMNNKNKDFDETNKLQLENYKKNIKKLEGKLKMSINETNKANQIIARLSGDIRKKKDEIKLKNSVMLQQEHVIEKNKEKITELELTIIEKNKKIGSLEINIAQLEATIENLTKKIEKSEESLIEMRDMMKFMNKKKNMEESTPAAFKKTYGGGGSRGLGMTSSYLHQTAKSQLDYNPIPIQTRNYGTDYSSSIQIPNIKNRIEKTNTYGGEDTSSNFGLDFLKKSSKENFSSNLYTSKKLMDFPKISDEGNGNIIGPGDYRTNFGNEFNYPSDLGIGTVKQGLGNRNEFKDEDDLEPRNAKNIMRVEFEGKFD